MTISFAHPERLWLASALAVLALAGAAAGARRARDWAALGQPGRPAGERRRLWMVCALGLVVALAGPRWGRSDAPPRPAGHDVVLALDVSRSMGALDAVPDRLGVAVEAAGSLVEALGRAGGERVAVVAFAGRGVLRCPLTTNAGAAVAALARLRPGGVRPGGTDLAAGLLAALDAFDDQDRAGGRSVVILSDGEDHAGRWRAAAATLRERGVVVHAVAVGDDRHGHPVPARPDESDEPLVYHGHEVLSRRSDEALAAVARETGGAFVPLGLAATDLGRLYRTRIEPVERARRGGLEAPEPAERFGVFLLAALAAGLAACLPSRAGGSRPRGWVFAVPVAILATAPGAAPPGDPVAAVAAGRRAYAAGRFAEALESFRRAERLAPANATVRYDVAAALFQLGRHAEARAAYLDARALTRDHAPLRTTIDFALGNTALALGDPAAAIAHYDDCLASTAPGAGPDRVRADAAVNRRFAEEQARPDPPPDESGDEVGKPAPPGDDRDRAPRGQAGRSPAPGGEEAGPQAGPPGASRGAGGAGGAGGGEARPRPGTPEQRLARALENVRQAAENRIEEPDESEPTTDDKDW